MNIMERQGHTNLMLVNLFIVVFLAIFLTSNVSAAEVYVSHGNVSDTSASDPQGIGFEVIPNMNLTLTKATLMTSGAFNWVEVWRNDTTSYTFIGANTSVVGQNATLNISLTQGQTYAVIGKLVGGGAYTIYWQTATKVALVNKTEFAFKGEIRNVTGGISRQDLGQWQNFLGLTVDIPAETAVPTISLNFPTNNSNTTTNVTFSITSNRSNSSFALVNVSLYLNGVLNETKSITGAGNISTFNKLVSVGNVHNWTAITCDNFNCSLVAGNRSFTSKKIIEEIQEYSASGLEVSSQIFKMNITLSSGYTISAINLTYNSTNNTASFTAYNSTLYQATATISLPSVSSNTNKTFNWTILLTDASIFLSSNNNQTVVNLGLDNCSTNNITILNFTMRDEASQTIINATAQNSSVQVDVTLYSNAANTNIANTFSSSYSQTNPFRVCISNELGSTSFYMTTVVQYDSNDYQTEFYNIQNYSLNATSNPIQNTSLYDLLSTTAQIFKITYRDGSFLPVSNALIQVQRKYISEGAFKTVEIPKTDTNGQATASLVIDSVIYTFTVVKNGQLLATFDNVLAVCQNPEITECTIELNSFSSTIPVVDFEEENDFTFTLGYNRSTRTITSAFTIPSGASSTIVLNVTKEDALGTSICSESVVTSAGSLTCLVGNSFGNGTVTAKLYKDGILVGSGQINLATDSDDIYGGSQVLLLLFIILTLIGASISNSPIYTTLFLMLGIILVYSLNLITHSGFIGSGATILFLIIAFILILIKGVKRN